MGVSLSPKCYIIFSCIIDNHIMYDMLSGVCVDVLFTVLHSLSPAPPLTVDNIMKAVEGVKNWRVLANWLGVPGGSSLKNMMEGFLRGGGRFKPSWRAFIFALDGAEETHLANRIRSYGEPVQGVCVCVCVCVCVY